MDRQRAGAGHQIPRGRQFHQRRNRLSPDSASRSPPRAHSLGLGQLLGARGDHWPAADTFQSLVAIAPRSVKAWSRLAIEFQALGRHADAAGAFRKVLELDPELPGAQYVLGRSLAQLRQTDEAAKLLSVVRDGSDRPIDPVLRAKARIQLQRLSRTRTLATSSWIRR
ncbi:tetratricopeptide repeat protein [Mesorhizobium sp. M3A.F.Ca.ET.174.01.1.1]|nr:tetratricopeptide repeat protein [Mesorhizobium sp. M3A.F.Ca.ET.175.01.1.1]TGT22785.1 tetratricopeptide repeat protein [Mesorhizobium sp. M3A.F.Ca.ET.174.01.1.1]